MRDLINFGSYEVNNGRYGIKPLIEYDHDKVDGVPENHIRHYAAEPWATQPTADLDPDDLNW